jgi:hypothetical protein
MFPVRNIAPGDGIMQKYLVLVAGGKIAAGLHIVQFVLA